MMKRFGRATRRLSFSPSSKSSVSPRRKSKHSSCSQLPTNSSSCEDGTPVPLKASLMIRADTASSYSSTSSTSEEEQQQQQPLLLPNNNTVAGPHLLTTCISEASSDAAVMFHSHTSSRSPSSLSQSASPSSVCLSLGTGTFSLEDGTVQEFKPSPTKPPPPSPPPPENAFTFHDDHLLSSKAKQRLFGVGKRSTKKKTTKVEFNKSSTQKKALPPSLPSPTTTIQQPSKSILSSVLTTTKTLPPAPPPFVFQRHMCTFLRVADLGIPMDQNDDIDGDDDQSRTTTTSSAIASYPNYSFPSSEPPPGLEFDPTEKWVALDDGHKNVSPMATVAVKALYQRGLQTSLDTTFWTPSDTKTAKLAETKSEWTGLTFQNNGTYVVASAPSVDHSTVLVWTGSFPSSSYGSEIPAVRAAGWIDMPPRHLFDLLLDSTRVQEYNKMSLGRTDDLVLQDNLTDHLFRGITKVMTSQSRPPIVRKTLKFTSLFHARELHDHSGYLLVTRAVTAPGESLGGEILFGVNVIKRIQHHPHASVLLTVNHIRSPLVPMMIAKRIGLAAAVNFLHDLQRAAAAGKELKIL